MSRFLCEKYVPLDAYTPGEQPQDKKYIKLNTNESPYPPSEKTVTAAGVEAEKLNLYSDPTAKVLKTKIAKTYGVEYENVFVSNGSDEILEFFFMAFCSEKDVAYPEISYGFYPVYAQLFNSISTVIPLKEDFSVDADDYKGINKNIVIANPNAPTGIALSKKQIEEILITNPDNLVLIDEAYVDFGAESCTDLIKKYKNLIVCMTFSKSRSLAGGRLGFCFADAEIIKDLEKIKYSTNPYNVNRMTQACGAACMDDNDYYMDNARKIIKTRGYLAEEYKKLGFYVTDSSANFIFAKHSDIPGEEFYKLLKEEGILVRHFTKEKIADFVRISIGTEEEIETLVEKTKEILSKRG